MSGKISKLAFLAPEIPSLSATFVYNEILNLEQKGLEVLPVSLHIPGNFEKKKDNNKLFHICKKALDNDLNIFPKRFKTDKKLKNKRKKKFTINHDCSITKIHKKYFILIPIKETHKYKKAKYDTISLDPGVRTFQTCYSPNGFVGDINTDTSKTENYYERLNNINMEKEKGKTKINIKNKLTSLRTKMKNKISNFHWNSIKFLVENFNNIVIPKFGVKNMVLKKDRKLHKSTVKDMLKLSHSKFLEKLKFKCEEYQRNLIICSEEYTSKTCGKCGLINKKLGSSKRFECDKCKIKIDRDINGARNILLKNLI